MTNIRIELDEVTAVDGLEFRRLDERYKSAHMVGTAILYAILAAVALLLLLADQIWLCIAAEVVIVAAAAVNLMLLPKAFGYKGFALRQHDISYRSGIIFPKITTVPFCKVQQVSISQNPVSRMFHLYAVEIVNGAQQMASLSIPGLRKDTALQIKNLVTEKISDVQV